MFYLVDRNLTPYISQSVPSTGPPQTISEILFSADNLTLIVTIKGLNASMLGYLLFYLLYNSNTMLSSSPTQVTPTNGLLITDPRANGVLTLTYSSTNGMISNNMFTSVNTSLASALCWSTYSPKIGNYYVIGVGTATIVELNISINSNTRSVQIIQHYQLPNNTGANEAIVVIL